MTDLKPCRFCGIVPHAWLDDYINGRAVTDPEYIIECENGNCSVMPEVRGTYPYMDEVRAMWNTANALSAVQPDTTTLVRLRECVNGILGAETEDRERLDDALLMIADLIKKPAVQSETEITADAIRDVALRDAITHARQALVDAAHTFRGRTNTMYSTIFTAEDIVTAAIHSLLTKKDAKQ